MNVRNRPPQRTSGRGVVARPVPSRPVERSPTAPPSVLSTSNIPPGVPPSKRPPGGIRLSYGAIPAPLFLPRSTSRYGRFFSYFSGCRSNFERHIGQQNPITLPWYFVLKRGSTLLPRSTGHVSL